MSVEKQVALLSDNFRLAIYFLNNERIREIFMQLTIFLRTYFVYFAVEFELANDKRKLEKLLQRQRNPLLRLLFAKIITNC